MAPGSRWRLVWMGVNVFALGILLCSCLLEGSAAAKAKKTSASTDTAAKKLDHLAALDPIVTLTDSNFTRYAEGRKRPYHVVVLFTALEDKHRCISCRMIEEPYGAVAKAYAQQFDLRETEHKVVFARIDVQQGGTTFGTYGVQTAPRMFLVPQGKTFPAREYIGEFEVTKGMIRADQSVDDFLHDLEAITGAKVVVLPDTSGLLMGALLLGIFLGVVAHFLAESPSRVLTMARHKGLWFLVSLGCYIIGVGGMIYCIIRNPKTHGYHQSGDTAMFSPGGRDQFWYEGAVVGVVYLLMSAALMGMYFAAGWKRAPSLLRTAAILACATVLCYVASEYMALYTKKTSWYSLKELLPPGFSEFHTEPLKRKHGLLRRLVRLSHLWLNEYKGARPFCAKLKTLLWDYLVRRVDGALGGFVMG